LIVQSASEDVSLIKTRFPEIAGGDQVPVSAPL
jgi:hypothetical protein